MTGIYLIDEAYRELNDFFVFYSKTLFSFVLANSFLNYQSFFVWTFMISATDFICIRIISFILKNGLPKSIHFLLYGDLIAEMIALGIISLIFNQPLLLLFFARALLYLFRLYATIFASLPLESIAISFYLKSFWFVLPFFINVLISMFYLIDMLLSIKLFMSILDISFVNRLLTSLGIRIDLMYPKPDAAMDSALKVEEEWAVEQLKSLLKSHFFEKSITKFRDYLKEQFEINPGLIKDDSGQVQKLPLDACGYIKNVSAEKKQRILSQYYQNTTHTLWRMMLVDNPFIARDEESMHIHQSYHEKLYQEWMVLNWLLAKEVGLEGAYLADLAKLYRGKNHQPRQIKFFMSNINNHGFDKPADLSDLRFFLTEFSDTYGKLDILTPSKIYMLLEEYMTMVWSEKLKRLDKPQMLKLKKQWDELHGKIKFMKYFNLSDVEVSEFIDQMSLRYKDKWVKQPYYAKLVHQFFDLDNYFINHAHKFSSLFQSKLTALEPTNVFTLMAKN